MLDVYEIFSNTVALAEEIYSIDCSELDITIDEKPKGKAAAFYRPKTKTIHLNNIMLNTFSDNLIKTTIIHEIAHYVQEVVYPNAKQMHGPEFKSIDKALGGEGTTYVKSRACSDKFMEVLNSNKPKAQTFKYTCSGSNKCESYNFTKNRHTRVLNGAGYICGKCKSPLKLDK